MELVFTDQKGQVEKLKVFEFKSPGIALAMYNLDDSIASFAHSSFQVWIQNKIIFNKINILYCAIFVIRWHYLKSGHFICQQKILSLKSMMEDLKTFFKIFMKCMIIINILVM